MKERTWLGILLSFAAPCRGKMAGSVVLAILSVAGGFVPYLGVYQIIRLFLERQADWDGIVFWCGVCLAGYAVKVAGYALSTMLAHVSTYTILEGLRLQVADRLMGAPLGEVESRPIGSMKSTIVDRIEDVEPPLAHMIPELSSNLLLPLVVVIAMFAIDWRMGLALLVTIPVALIPMTFGMRTYNKNYAAYMEANAHVNSVIVEYVEGIQVVKAFSQGERSYQKFAQAVASFRDFTMGWFRCTWASMNLCLSILPTTLLGRMDRHRFMEAQVPVHSAHHSAGDPAGGRRALSGGYTGPGPGDALPDAGPGNRVPPDERHRLHQLYEKYAVCSEGHP